MGHPVYSLYMTRASLTRPVAAAKTHPPSLMTPYVYRDRCVAGRGCSYEVISRPLGGVLGQSEENSASETQDEAGPVATPVATGCPNKNGKLDPLSISSAFKILNVLLFHMRRVLGSRFVGDVGVKYCKFNNFKIMNK